MSSGDYYSIKEQANGRWLEILYSLGIEVKYNKHSPCPVCREGRDRFRFSDTSGDGEWICSQCGNGNALELIKRVKGVDFQTALDMVKQIVGDLPEKKMEHKDDKPKYNPTEIRALYATSKPLTGNCLGSQYLKNRGLNVIPKTLRFTTRCYEPQTRSAMPAILATFTDPEGEAITLQRIYLKAGGYKADIEVCKRTMTPKKPMSGGAVRLFEPSDKGTFIGIAEGIETALAVHQLFDIPVWATLSSNLMAKWEPPMGIMNVVIYGDADKNYTGQKAAYTLANKLAIKGLNVSVEIPEVLGDDFLDVLNRRDENEDNRKL